MAYSTRIRINNSKNGKNRSAKRSYASKKWQKKTKTLWLGRFRREKVKKAIFVVAGLFLVFVFVGAIFLLSYVQTITEDLPSPDKPFGTKNAPSEIYDRNGNLLYRKVGNDDRDLVKLADVPPLLRWSYLAAEDISFYENPGVDLQSLISCGLRSVINRSITCGGSTITQQLIKQTAVGTDVSAKRKINEIILALQITKTRSKDEILEMYLDIVPEGSNVYGVSRASQVYFGKEMKDLNLAQMAILAAIPQNPIQLSPTLSSDQDTAQKRVKDRQNYVLDQMSKYKDKINSEIKQETGQDNALTDDMIQQARDYVLVYRKPTIDIKAPHFVFYALQLLQERGYNNGQPFTLDQIENGGYKIYTTLDMDYQQMAEEQVTKGVDIYGKRYGANNAALIAMNPKNGEIMAMVGSKNWFGDKQGCDANGNECSFDPQVNVLTTLQSYGSSLKPMIYYDAIMNGLISPGSIVADIPIQIGNYKPHNFEGGVYEGLQPAHKLLTDSENIPAIILLNKLGVDNFISDMKKWGYTTFTNPTGYGPALAVGGADVKLIEHAQAYGVLANNGQLTMNEAILKIVDRDGNVVFNYQPQSTQVADPRGVYLVDNMLNSKNGGPPDPKQNDGRDLSGKTGTSESQKETLFFTYTPEMVVGGWLGNNNNKSMRGGVSGFNSARPWIGEFMQRILPSFPKTPFPRPGGISFRSACEAAQGASCDGVAGGDLAITDIPVPSYVSVQTAVVCVDQPDHLARDIDIQLGKSVSKQFRIYKMVDSRLQSFLDAWLASNVNYGSNSVPIAYCDINRNPGGTQDPWAVFSQPTSGQIISGSTVQVQFNAYSASGNVTKIDVAFDGVVKDAGVTTLPYNKAIDVGSPTPGIHVVDVKVYDATGAIGSSSVSVEVLGAVAITSPNPSDTITASTPIAVNFTYTGNLDAAHLFVNGTQEATCTYSAGSGTCTWNVPATPGPATLEVKGVRKGQTINSGTVSVTIAP